MQSIALCASAAQDEFKAPMAMAELALQSDQVIIHFELGAFAQDIAVLCVTSQNYICSHGYSAFRGEPVFSEFGVLLILHKKPEKDIVSLRTAIDRCNLPWSTGVNPR